MNLSSFIWSVADLLRGKYKPHEYGRVILPFTVLRRMDCVLEPTKQAVLKEVSKHSSSGAGVNPFLVRASGTTFYNTNRMDLKAVVNDPDNVAVKSGGVSAQLLAQREGHLRPVRVSVADRPAG
jgi:type I restriction enzyme M protein